VIYFVLVSINKNFVLMCRYLRNKRLLVFYYQHSSSLVVQAALLNVFYVDFVIKIHETRYLVLLLLRLPYLILYVQFIIKIHETRYLVLLLLRVPY
jgi:hypothetical protein